MTRFRPPRRGAPLPVAGATAFLRRGAGVFATAVVAFFLAAPRADFFGAAASAGFLRGGISCPCSSVFRRRLSGVELMSGAASFEAILTTGPGQRTTDKVA